MLYTVKYKHHSSSVWQELINVKGDGFIDEAKSQSRWFILDDETRVEIPVNGFIFMFDKNRFLSIKAHMESQVGQPLAMHQSK